MIYVPQSKMPGIAWPAISDGLSAHAMALQYQLQQSQWWSEEELRSMQFEQLAPLVHFAYQNSPAYQKFYQQHGFRPRQTLNAQKWQEIPIMTRDYVQQAGSELHCRNIPREHGENTPITTSGSTGRQVTLLTNQVTQLFWNAFNLRDHLWQQRNLRGKLATIRLDTMHNNIQTISHEQQAQSWGAATQFYKTGPSVFLDIRTDVTQQLAWLQKHNPHYLLTYPSNLRALLELARDKQIRLSQLHQVRTLGEIVTPELRELCRSVWNVVLIDGYSCQEAGCLALQCPQHDHYHVQSEGVLLEVLNENNQACKAGEIGRVVVSSLHNFASPLIRYAIGDYAEVGEACSCGRGLPVLKRILGRVRNMLHYPNGEQHWPYVGSSEYRAIADVRQFQLIQTDLNTIEVHLVVGGGKLPAEKEREMTTHLNHSLGHAFQLHYHYREEIPRSKGGKYEDFISRIDA